jgi:hypothetical protein
MPAHNFERAKLQLLDWRQAAYLQPNEVQYPETVAQKEGKGGLVMTNSKIERVIK